MVFLLCLLVKNMSADKSADRFNSEESDNDVHIGLVGTSHLRERIDLSILAISNSCAQLADLEQCLNLCYRFTLLNENNANMSKSPPSLNIAVWDHAK